jgi:hypothetical protein
VNVSHRALPRSSARRPCRARRGLRAHPSLPTTPPATGAAPSARALQPASGSPSARPSCCQCRKLTPCRGRRPHHVRRDRIATWEVSGLAAAVAYNMRVPRSASARRGAVAADARKREVGPPPCTMKPGRPTGKLTMDSTYENFLSVGWNAWRGLLIDWRDVNRLGLPHCLAGRPVFNFFQTQEILEGTDAN